MKEMMEVARAIANAHSRIRRIESQMHHTPVRYTVGGAGYLTEDEGAGSGTINVSSVPEWATDDCLYVLIGAGDEDCEARKVTSISDNTLTLDSNTANAWDQFDPVVFLPHPVLNVKYWGANGDGVTDDSTPIQNCAAEVRGLPEGGLMYLPAGTYYVGGTIALGPEDDTGIVGDGIAQTVIHFTHATANPGITFIGAGAGSPTYGHRVIGLEIRTASSGPTNGIELTYCQDTVIRELHAKATFVNCIQATDCERLVLDIGTYTGASGDGIELRDVDDSVVMGNQVYSNGGDNIYVWDGSEQVSIVANQCNGAGSNIDIYIDGSTGSAVDGIVTAGNTLHSTTGIYRDGPCGTRTFNTEVPGMWLPPRAFENISGATWTNTGTIPHYWSLPDGSTSTVGVYANVPRRRGTTETVWVYVYFFMPSAAGNVRLQLGYLAVNQGEAVNAAVATQADTVVTAGINNLNIHMFSTAISCSYQELLRLEFSRLGAHGDDTCLSELCFLGMDIVRGGHTIV